MPGVNLVSNLLATYKLCFLSQNHKFHLLSDADWTDGFAYEIENKNLGYLKCNWEKIWGCQPKIFHLLAQRIHKVNLSLKN
jgi:SPX domain protein involved in polyphosphate accumulation